MPIVFYSLLVIIVPVIASFILFFRIKKNNILVARDFFWHHAFGFGILSLIAIPIFFINLGVHISYNALIILYAISFVALFLSYLLFYRGTVLLFTRDRFLTTMFPIILLPIISAFCLTALFYLKLSTILIYTAIAWGFLFVNNNMLATIFLYSFATGSPIKMMKRKFPALLLSLGWFLMLALDVFIWLSAALYHPELWILKISSLKGWFLLRAITYLIILIGVLLCSRYLQRPKVEEKE